MDSTYNLENTQSNHVKKSKIDQIITKLWKATVGAVRKAEKIMSLQRPLILLRRGSGEISSGCQSTPGMKEHFRHSITSRSKTLACKGEEKKRILHSLVEKREIFFRLRQHPFVSLSIYIYSKQFCIQSCICGQYLWYHPLCQKYFCQTKQKQQKFHSFV